MFLECFMNLVSYFKSKKLQITLRLQFFDLIMLPHDLRIFFREGILVCGTVGYHKLQIDFFPPLK